MDGFEKITKCSQDSIEYFNQPTSIPNSLLGILKKSITISFSVIRKLWFIQVAFFLLFISIMALLQETMTRTIEITSFKQLSIFFLIMFAYFIFSTTRLADLIWRKLDLKGSTYIELIATNKVFRIIGTMLYLGIFTFLIGLLSWLLFYSIYSVLDRTHLIGIDFEIMASLLPFVYFSKRILSLVIIVLEDLPAEPAIKKSKFFVETSPWNRLDSPFIKTAAISFILLIAYAVIPILVEMISQYASPYFTNDYLFYAKAVLHCLFYTVVLNYTVVCLVGIYLNVKQLAHCDSPSEPRESGNSGTAFL